MPGSRTHPNAGLVSVVVPIYDVEPYLRECLDSIAAQTWSDLQVVMVDDGSPDHSAEIAADFAAADARFELIQQANQGLGAARNAGIEKARGEFLRFVDSDDKLPPGSCELMLRTLLETGSDFVTGAARRFSPVAVWHPRLLRPVHESTTLETHVSERTVLTRDTIVNNKLYRRDFWESAGLSFPEGVLYEDIITAVSGHVLAGQVDVLNDVVYLWRRRERESSISQQKHETRNITHRFDANTELATFLESRSEPAVLAAHHTKVIAFDIPLYVREIPGADERFTRTLIETVGNYLEQVPSQLVAGLPAVNRLQVEAIADSNRPLLHALGEMAISKEGLVRQAGEPRLSGHVPGEVAHDPVDLRNDLIPQCRVTSVRFDTDTLIVEGLAFIENLPRAAAEDTDLRAFLIAPEVTPVELAVSPVLDPVHSAPYESELASLEWCGIRILVPIETLITSEPKRPGWQIQLELEQGTVRRTVAVGSPTGRSARSAGYLDTANGYRVRPTFKGDGPLTIAVGRPRAMVTALRWEGSALRVSGRSRQASELVVRCRSTRREQAAQLSHSTSDDPLSFEAAIDLSALSGHHPAPFELDLYVRTGKSRLRRLAVAGGLVEVAGALGDLDLVAGPTNTGNATVWVAPPRLLVDGIEWADDQISVQGPRPDRELRLWLEHSETFEAARLDLEISGDRFTAGLDPRHAPTMEGVLALASGTWHLKAAGPWADRASAVRRVATRRPSSKLEDGREIGANVHVLRRRWQGIEIDVAPAHRDPGSGAFHQRQLQADFAVRRETQPISGTTVYFESQGGRTYGGDPRAIYEELLHRNEDLEFVWASIRGRLPAAGNPAIVVPGSPEYYEVLATARHVISDTDAPKWFGVRDGQARLRCGPGTAPAGQGNPRNDILYSELSELDLDGIRHRVGLPDRRPAVLMVPAPPDPEVAASQRHWFGLPFDLGELQARFAGELSILIRLHPGLDHGFDLSRHHGFVFDVSRFPDLGELFALAAVLITNSAANAADFSNTGRPILPFGALATAASPAPGPETGSVPALVGALEDLAALQAQWAGRYAGFTTAHCADEDGAAAARVVERELADLL